MGISCVPGAVPVIPPDPSGRPAISAPDELREQIRALERGGVRRPAAVMPLGVEALDRCLPSGGLALGRIHEVVGESRSEVRDGAAFGFVSALLARLMRTNGEVLWCPRGANPHGGMPGARGLTQLGLDPARIIVAEARGDTDRLWAMEEGLGCTGLLAVVAELGPPRPQARTRDSVSCRRLQLAAEASGVTGILLRPDAGQPASAAGTPDSRWRVTSAPHAFPWAEGDGWGEDDWRPRWHVELLRARNGRPGEAHLIWDPVQGVFHCPDPFMPKQRQPAPPARIWPNSARSVA